MGKNILHKILNFYVEGFRNMTVGKTLWIIILIKLFILFAVLRLIFFPDFLKKNFSSDEERSNYVIEELTKH
jgi:flagellar basal body-associated protein FliL